MRHWKRQVVLAGALIALAASSATAQIETTIYELQQDSLVVGTFVMVDSVVVIGVDRRPSTFGVYIQEPAGGPYSGILCYLSGATPAYSNSNDPVQVGDLVTARGDYADFGGLAEIEFPTIEKLGEVTPLAPEVLTIDVVTNSAPDGGEQWEGVLIQLNDVHVTFVESGQFRDWEMAHFGGTSPILLVYEKMIDGQVVPAVGDSLSSVTGVADLFDGDRRLAPRDNDDLVFLTGGPPPSLNPPALAWSSADDQVRVRFLVQLDETDAETTTNYSLSSFQDVTAAVYDNPTRTVTLTIESDLVPSTTPHTLSVSNLRSNTGVPMVGSQSTDFTGGISTIEFIRTNPSITADTSQVTVRGVVTAAGDGIDWFPQEGGFYIQDRMSSTNGGLFIFGPPIMPTRGDSVLVSGAVLEFGVGPTTEITGVDEIQIYANVTEIPPVDVALDDVAGSDATAELYEGMLVRLSNVHVITGGLEFAGDPFDITSAGGGDTLRVDDDAIDEGSLRMISNNPTEADTLRSGYLAGPYDILNVTGVMTYSGTTPFQRLQPRNWNEPSVGGDIELLGQGTDVPGARFPTALGQNTPNPFNPTTRIDYTIGTAGQASMHIFDLRGRLVATLFDEHRAAGTGHVVWDGRDLSGRQTPSGVYWYRLLTAAGEDRTKKMVLLK